jgi:polysaccharide biosynthesis transport protein
MGGGDRVNSADMQFADTFDGGQPAGHGGAAPQVPGGEFSLGSLLAVARRRAVLAAAVAIVAVIIGTIYTFTLTPRYTATATVLFEESQNADAELQQVLDAGQRGGISVSNQLAILTSRNFAAKLVDQLHLTEDPEFNVAISGRTGMFGPLARMIFGARAPSPSEKADERNATIDAFVQHLQPTVEPETSVIDVAFTSESPEKAARIANAVADTYLVDQLDARYESARVANDWLGRRLDEMKTKVQAAEEAVSSYAAEHNLLTISQTGGTALDQNLSQLNTELVQARSDLAEAQVKYSRVRQIQSSGGSLDAIPELMSSPVFQGLRTQRAQLLQQQAELSTRYEARHPEMIKIAEEIRGIDQQLGGETARLVSALQSQVQVASARVGVIEGSLRQAEGQSAGANKDSVKLHELQTNAQSAQALYDAFLKRFNETGEQQTLKSSAARVISRATIPNAKSYPRTTLFLGVSALIALALAAIAAFFAEQLDRTLRTREQVESALGQPMLASLPLVDAAETAGKGGGTAQTPAEIVVSRPLSAYSEAFHSLRAALRLSNVDEQPVLVLITSALPGEGKSTGAVALARSSAISGQKVLLIDADVRRPSLAKVVGLDATGKPGLVQCLTGEAKPADVIIRDTLTKVDIILTGASVSNPPDLLSSEAMANFLKWAKANYDLVVLDSAPVLPVIDTRLMARMVDTVLFFVRWESTPKDGAREGIRLLQSFNARIAGVALTMMDRHRQQRYGYYGDSYAYYGKYKNYYTAT